jgi:hypothetical protein
MTTVPDPKPAPYGALKKMCEAALLRTHSTRIDVFVMMAVCVKESMGSPWFCRCDSLYKTNLEVVAKYVGQQKAGQFVSLITSTNPYYFNKIPKFRFEPAWYAAKSVLFVREGFPLLESLAMCASYGIAQKGALWLPQGADAGTTWLSIKSFMSDPDLQLTQLCYDLHSLHAEFGGNMELALTRYNAGAGAKRISGYGVQCVALANELRALYG